MRLLDGYPFLGFLLPVPGKGAIKLLIKFPGRIVGNIQYCFIGPRIAADYEAGRQEAGCEPCFEFHYFSFNELAMRKIQYFDQKALSTTST